MFKKSMKGNRTALMPPCSRERLELNSATTKLLQDNELVNCHYYYSSSSYYSKRIHLGYRHWVVESCLVSPLLL
jgi:hypothetical protein